MARRKYRLLDARTAAESALSSLISKIPEMKTNYSAKMDEFSRDTTKQSAYVAGVELWINTMRSADVRSTISKAIADARAKYKTAIESARVRITTRR